MNICVYKQISFFQIKCWCATYIFRFILSFIFNCFNFPCQVVSGKKGKIPLLTILSIFLNTNLHFKNNPLNPFFFKTTVLRATFYPLGILNFKKLLKLDQSITKDKNGQQIAPLPLQNVIFLSRVQDSILPRLFIFFDIQRNI